MSSPRDPELDRPYDLTPVKKNKSAAQQQPGLFIDPWENEKDQREQEEADALVVVMPRYAQE